ITVDETGQNEIIVISGSNMNLTPVEIESRSELFENVSVVLTQLEIPIETVVKTAELAKKHGAIFILNPAPVVALSDGLYSLVDFITPNENELELLSGIKITNEQSVIEASKILLNKSVKNVIVTLGDKGCMLINDQTTKHFNATKVNVIDSTAAGDAFNGALAASLSDGHLIDEAIEFANKVASISVTRMGAQSSLPYLHEIGDLYSV
ncbi:MAG TPA: ribokinase, partial [Ignavibacteriaceae bacterium]